MREGRHADVGLVFFGVQDVVFYPGLGAALRDLRQVDHARAYTMRHMAHRAALALVDRPAWLSRLAGKDKAKG